MDTYILIHGAWHEGALLEDTAKGIRSAGHQVHTPTLAGNGAGDNKQTGLAEAIDSVIAYITENHLKDAILVGHSYGGMVITGAFDKLPEGTIKRLVYWNAFVPNPGESLNDMIPQNYVDLFDATATEDGSVLLPFPIWREVFINDADMALAKAAYDKLNPHPYKTFTDAIALSKAPAEMQVGKSYLLCRDDVALPASMPWHPRLSERLGLYRLVSMPGSHEVCFTNPGLLAEKMIEAGRD
ncbi:alpha/beta hydrolase [Alphaproteobacteria bacterium]|jgi:pimeloyl-ACP methyl ester carboxylesterase|nr:alpha/beta hydrolase [Alphaproteobacteria bacterium]NCF49558.1 alpha/beta fold hydrolase [Bacteroidota bacterium]